MAVREFDGVDDNIVCATGGLSAMTHGTVAVLVQRRATGDFYALMGVNTSASALLGSVLIWNNGAWTWFTAGGGSKGPASPLTTWALVVVRKGTGSTTPRFSVFDYGTSVWTHQAGDAAQGDWTAPGVGGQIAFSDATNDFPAIRVAARAAWSNEVHWSADAAGDAAIEAAGLQSALANWVAESPTALWRFNQSTTAEAVVDETGGGADQTSITGTTVVAGDDPPGFDFSLGAEIAANGAAHSHTAGQPALTQVHELAVDDASHTHTADQVAVQPGGDVAPDDAGHSHTAGQPALTQTHQLTTDNASHGHTASEPNLDGLDIFSGSTLPDGWTAVQPAATAVTLPGGHLQLGIDPGRSLNSLSAGVNSPQGPLVWRPVSGAFDFAVGLAEEATNLPDQGLDLLALDDDMTGGVRLGAFCGAQTGTFRQDVGWFVWGSNAGTVVNATGDDLMGDLYGGPGWLRLAYDGAGTWTCYASHTGLSGSWHQLASFADTFTPTRFAIHANAVDSGADGRVQRINRVVDLAARGTDDATDQPTVDSRPTLFTEDFAGGTLPGWLTAVTANNGTVTTTTAGVELAIDEATFQSQAWLVGPSDLPPSHGMLLRYRLTGAGFVNAFWVPAVSVDTTTDIPGAETPDDKWGDGTSLIMEMPAREHVADGQLLRLLRRSPIAAGASQSGTREFDGYTLMVEDPAAPVSTVGQPLTWIRIERVGHWLQVRLWLDGDPEPSTWHYQAQDHMRHGLGTAITLSQNDGVAGANTASVRVDRVTVYEVLSGANLTADGASHGHTAEQPAVTQVHQLAVDGPTHVHAADGPSLAQVHTLAPAAADHVHTAEQVTLTAGVVLAPDGASHSHSAGVAGLAQQHLVAADSAQHAHAAIAASLTQLHLLAAGDAAHTQTADQVAFGAPVVPGLLTPGATGPTLAADATRPALAASSTRPALTSGRSPNGQ